MLSRKISIPILIAIIEDFTAAQILREIKLGNFRSSKSAILAILEAIILIFEKIPQLKLLKIQKILKF